MKLLIEGHGGTGKTSLGLALQKLLEERGKPHHFIEQPSREVRRYMHADFGLSVAQKTALLCSDRVSDYLFMRSMGIKNYISVRGFVSNLMHQGIKFQDFILETALPYDYIIACERSYGEEDHAQEFGLNPKINAKIARRYALFWKNYERRMEWYPYPLPALIRLPQDDKTPEELAVWVLGEIERLEGLKNG